MNQSGGEWAIQLGVAERGESTKTGVRQGVRPDFELTKQILANRTRGRKSNEKLFMCVLKVVDPSFCAKGEFAQLIMYAYKFEDLPICHRVGDVIRVNRANLRMYKN